VPARPLWLAGTFVLAAGVAVSACDRSAGESAAGPRVLELDSARITLPDSVRLQVITLRRSQSGDLEPARSAVRVGDIVRFEAADAGAHAIGFDGTALPPEARRFLEATGQMRSPPLLSAGNAWVLNFTNAPPGEYPYQCATHGARGSITVQPR
jgi:plastocyanin